MQDIHFDYSLRAQQLLTHLAQEALNKLDGEISLFPVGVCVRRVPFKSHRQWVRTYHQELSQSVFGEAAVSYSSEKRNGLQKQAAKHYTGLRDVSLLAIRYAMPDLESFEHISRSPAMHIKLARVKIDQPWLFNQHMNAKDHWAPRFDCETCNKDYGSQKAANQHMNVKKDWAPTVPCESCDKKFQDVDAANRHMTAKNH